MGAPWGAGYGGLNSEKGLTYEYLTISYEPLYPSIHQEAPNPLSLVSSSIAAFAQGSSRDGEARHDVHLPNGMVVLTSSYAVLPTPTYLPLPRRGPFAASVPRTTLKTGDNT